MRLADDVAHGLGRRFPAKRVSRLIVDAIHRYSLDLTGLTVLTEGATGYYRTTPVIAALAGAERVLAVTRDSRFGSRREAAAQVLDLAASAGVEARIDLSVASARAAAPRADVVTNLGAVRPLDARLARALASPRCAVSLMFGAEDARPADIDVRAIRARGIPVAGVDEAAIDLFRWTGQRIAWWLTECGVEIVGARLVVWGDDARTRDVVTWLRGAGGDVAEVRGRPTLADLRGADAIILMHRKARIEDGARLRPEAVARAAPGAAVLECAGTVDREALGNAGLLVYPPEGPSRGHVSKTIGEALYAPVVELHTAGLRVGEIMARARERGEPRRACERLAVERGPGEAVPTPRRAAEARSARRPRRAGR